MLDIRAAFVRATSTSRAQPRVRNPPPDQLTRRTVAKPLVIVESPTKARTIAGFLGRSGDLDATVMSSVGHVRDLPNKRDQLPDDKRDTHARLLGVNPDDHF